MSKTIAGAAATHIAQRVTTMAMCWKLTRVDGTVMGFTDYHGDLVISGVTYKGSTGMVRATALSGTADLGVDNTDVETVLDSTAIDREDLLAGKYDYADARIFLCDYLNPTAWEIKLLRGRLGEISVGQLAAKAELRSLTQMLKQRIGRSHETACPYDLGETKCGVNLASFTVTGSLTLVTNQHRLRDTSRTEAANWFNGGKITFTSGNCNGLSMEIKRWTGAGSTKEFVLSLDMPFPLHIGDTYSAIAGCDKTYATCQSKFTNQNFGGFPFIPGTDFALSFPNVPSS